MFDPAYISATKYFPAEPNWGTMSTTAFTIDTSGGGGGTTIVNNNNIGVLTLSAVGGSVSSGSFVFSNDNGVSFGINGSTLTASVAPGGGGGMTVSAGSETAASSLIFSDDHGITFGLDASTITASYNSTQFLNTGYTTHTHTQLGQALSGSNGSFSFQTATFGNLNGVSFYTSNGSMVASHNALTSQSNQAASGSNGSFTFQTITFGNLNGISHYTSNGSLVASHNALTSQSNQALSGSNGSFTFQTATFGNLNGASFYTSNGSMVLSYTVPTVTNSSLTLEDLDNGTMTVAHLAFDPLGAWAGAQGVGFTVSTGAGGTHTLYAAHNGLTTQSGQALSGSNGSFSFETATFGNLNGLSFYTSNGSLVGSYTVPTQTNQTIGVYGSSQTTGSASSGTHDARSLSFIGAGIVSIGNHSTSAGGTTTGIVISATQSNQAVSGSNGSFTFQTVTFGNLNNFSFYTSNGSIVGSYTVPTVTNSSWTVSDAATSGTVGRLAFTGVNGITLSLSTSNNGNHTVRATHDLQFTSNTSAITSNALHTSAAFRAVYDGANSVSTGTLRFTNANGVSFSINGQTISGSIATTYAGTGFTSAGANISLSGTLNTAGLSLSASVAAPGAAAENNWHHLLGANTAGNTTASGSTIGLSGINLTLSGTNASVINISAPATSSLSATGAISVSTDGSTVSIGVRDFYTRSGFNAYGDRPYVFTTNQGSLIIDPVNLPDVQFDRLVLAMNFTNATNSSGSQTVSHWVGIYTRNVSTLSLLGSTSGTTAITNSGTVGSYSLHSGLRLFTIPMITTLTEGRYWIGHVSRTTFGGANASFSVLAVSQLNSNFLGHFGSSHNTTYQFTLGAGVYNTTTSGIPNSIGFSQIRGSDNAILRPAIVMFHSSTV